MALPLYLAMTAAELFCAPELPPACAYMACHFSSYGTGLSNFPQGLPKGSMLIVNDRTPVQGHDPAQITEQLFRCVEEQEAAAILLDFQRPDCPETARIVRAVTDGSPCPTAVSACYGSDLQCPVFLPPVPPSCMLRDYISLWQGRELWLEAALDSQLITVTAQGSNASPFSSDPSNVYPFADPQLHCHYRIRTAPDQAQFFLQRTAEDLRALLQEAEALGITKAIGLYQELSPFSGALT